MRSWHRKMALTLVILLILVRFVLVCVVVGLCAILHIDVVHRRCRLLDTRQAHNLVVSDRPTRLALMARRFHHSFPLAPSRLAVAVMFRLAAALFVGVRGGRDDLFRTPTGPATTLDLPFSGDGTVRPASRSASAQRLSARVTRLAFRVVSLRAGLGIGACGISCARVQVALICHGRVFVSTLTWSADDLLVFPWPEEGALQS